MDILFSFRCGIFEQVFCAELPVFLRERRSRLYRTDTYFLGKSLAELPLFMLVPFIFITITYPMIGLRPTMYNYSVALGIVALVANVSTSFGKQSNLSNLHDPYSNISSPIHRLFDILCKFVSVDGFDHWTPAHHSVPAIRGILHE